MKTQISLSDYLHDCFLDCGEILPAAHIAQLVQEYEFENNVEHDASTILSAIREAGERFVDSKVENEHATEDEVKDGLYQGYPIDPLEVRIAKWEEMRPSKVRLSAILAVMQAAPSIVKGEWIQTPDMKSYAAYRVCENKATGETYHEYQGKRKMVKGQWVDA